MLIFTRWISVYRYLQKMKTTFTFTNEYIWILILTGENRFKFKVNLMKYFFIFQYPKCNWITYISKVFTVSRKMFLFFKKTKQNKKCILYEKVWKHTLDGNKLNNYSIGPQMGIFLRQRCMNTISYNLLYFHSLSFPLLHYINGIEWHLRINRRPSHKISAYGYHFNKSCFSNWTHTCTISRLLFLEVTRRLLTRSGPAIYLRW